MEFTEEQKRQNRQIQQRNHTTHPTTPNGTYPILVLYFLDQRTQRVEVDHGLAVLQLWLGGGLAKLFDGTSQRLQKPSNGLVVLLLVHVQYAQLALGQGIGTVGQIVGGRQKMLSQDQMIRPQVFHTNVQKADMIPGSETLSGTEGRQRLIGLVASGKGRSKGNPCLGALWIESSRTTKVTLGTVKWDRK
jgi:hypothetical protein